MPLYAVTFDFHNTLVECDAWFELEVRELVPRFLDWHAGFDGAPVTDADRHEAARRYQALREEIIHHGDEVDAYECVAFVLAGMGRTTDPATVRDGVDALMRGALPEARPVAGVVDAVERLREHGVTLGVVSSAVHHDFIEWSLERFGVLDAFDAIVSSAGCGFYKSRTDIYVHALSRLGASPEATVHIGDSFRYDVETASRAGIRTVWFDRSGANANGAVADLVVNDLHGVAARVIERFGAPS